jgi:hypothetical protein
LEDRPAAMRVALRVLTAVCDRIDPNPEDLDELKRIAPEFASLPAERLANAIIREIVEKRQEDRAKRASE